MIQAESNWKNANLSHTMPLHVSTNHRKKELEGKHLSMHPFRVSPPYSLPPTMEIQ